MNVYCVRCGKYRPHYCKGMDRDCYHAVMRKKRRAGDRPGQQPHVEPTLEELDALIAERLPTMPPDSDTKLKGMCDRDDAARRVAGVLRVVRIPGRVRR